MQAGERGGGETGDSRGSGTDRETRLAVRVHRNRGYGGGLVVGGSRGTSVMNLFADKNKV